MVSACSGGPITGLVLLLGSLLRRLRLRLSLGLLSRLGLLLSLRLLSGLGRLLSFTTLRDGLTLRRLFRLVAVLVGLRIGSGLRRLLGCLGSGGCLYNRLRSWCREKAEGRPRNSRRGGQS